MLIAPFVESFLTSKWTWRILGGLLVLLVLVTVIRAMQGWWVGEQHSKTVTSVEKLQLKVDDLEKQSVIVKLAEKAALAKVKELRAQNDKLQDDYAKLSKGKTIEEARKDVVIETHTDPGLLDSFKRRFGADATIASQCK